MVRRLLDDKPNYAEHWLTFWNDALRNDYRGTGYVDGGRKQITNWLYNALLNNVPYDKFVQDLTTGAGGSDGFIKGIVWRGVVNAAQTPQMQAAQNISQVFMGVNLKCASCHDSFINEWKLSDSYGLAGIYADKPLEMERCTKPLGQVAPMKFLFPQLGSIDPKASKEQRAAQLAKIITSPQNGRLARTVVNRLWKRFMGHGIIEPADDMDQDPWNADLLDWLATDLSDNGYDLKKTMERVLTSRAYQLPAATAKEGTATAYTFRGPLVRRMSAEEFVDAVATVTGVPAAKPAVKLEGVAPPPPNRTALSNADALTTALGRPAREQVITDRATVATTLEALELTNGETLADLLRRGSAACVKEAATAGGGSAGLIERIYARALGRKPSDAETKAGAGVAR